MVKELLTAMQNFLVSVLVLICAGFTASDNSIPDRDAEGLWLRFIVGVEDPWK